MIMYYFNIVVILASQKITIACVYVTQVHFYPTHHYNEYIITRYIVYGGKNIPMMLSDDQ